MIPFDQFFTESEKKKSKKKKGWWDRWGKKWFGPPSVSVTRDPDQKETEASIKITKEK